MNDRLKIFFGFGLLVILSALAFVVALGKVEQSTSYGLAPILTALATLAGAFSNWAFGHQRERDEPQPKVPLIHADAAIVSQPKVPKPDVGTPNAASETTAEEEGK